MTSALRLYRYSGQNDSTPGLLFFNDKFLCHTIEDAWSMVKFKGRTRIPAGTYEIELYSQGNMTLEYSKLFPKMHEGMLHLKNVPDYEGVLIHCGNTTADTMGCLLVGDVAYSNAVVEGSIGASRKCYERIYPLLRDAAKAGGLSISIYDEAFFLKDA